MGNLPFSILRMYCSGCHCLFSGHMKSLEKMSYKKNSAHAEPLFDPAVNVLGLILYSGATIEGLQRHNAMFNSIYSSFCVSDTKVWQLLVIYTVAGNFRGREGERNLFEIW